MLKRLTKIGINILLVLSIVSCVGTVENKNPPQKKGNVNGVGIIPFDGIDNAIGVAHDKVEVYFPAADGDPRDLEYLVSSNGFKDPRTFKGDALIKGYGNMYRVLINGLEIDKKYTFSVQAKNIKSFAISQSSETKSTATYSNIVSDFFGITMIQNLPGEEGKNSLVVKWVPSLRKGSVFDFNLNENVRSYQVILINKNLLLPTISNFENENLAQNQGRITVDVFDSKNADNNQVSEVIVNGLKGNTEYYIQVRAKQNGEDPAAGPSLYNEGNNKILNLKTLSDDLANIKFDSSSFTVKSSSGIAGRNSLDVSWGQAIGAFNHYRLYYQKTINDNWLSLLSLGFEQICNPIASVASANYACKEIKYDGISTTVTGLDTFVGYTLHLVICANFSCSSFVEFNPNPPSYVTNPDEVYFSGVTSVDSPSLFWELDTVTLNYDGINFSQGIIDGVQVKAQLGINGASCILNLPPLNTPSGCPVELAGLYVENFDIKTLSTGIKIKGFSTLSNTPTRYYFTLIPFMIQSGTFVDYANNIITKKADLKLATPSVIDFPGVNKVKSSSLGTLDISWNVPLAGLYDEFHIFVRKNPSLTDLGDVCFLTDLNTTTIPEESSFAKIILPYGSTSYNLTALQSDNYEVYVIPYFTGDQRYADCALNISAGDQVL